MPSICKTNQLKKTRWDIEPDLIKGENLLNAMYKDDEVSATFKVYHTVEQKCNQQKQCHLKKTTKVKLDKIKNGRGASVKTEHSLVNCHTHPFKCYNDEVCIWGWPSGEDIREVLLFVIEEKHLIHLVYCFEGIYSIEVNPLLSKFLIELPKSLASKLKKDSTLTENIIRGLLIYLVEITFKGTHQYRNCSFLKTIKQKQNFITPYDWIHFGNQFNLDIHIKGSQPKSKRKSTKIPTHGIPDLKRNKEKTALSIKEYIQRFEMDPFEVDDKGRCYDPESSNPIKTQVIKDFYNSYLPIINNKLKQYLKGNNWWFQLNFYQNILDKKNIVDFLLSSSFKTNKDRLQYSFHHLKQLYHSTKSNKKNNQFEFYKNVIPVCGYEITSQADCVLR